MRSTFVRRCFCRLVENVVGLNYYFADQISPVCAYNSRWERRLGVPSERIKVIFNGVDASKFQPREQAQRQRPQVSTVGAIYALKGQLYLMDAAAMIKAEFDALRVCCYGKANDDSYLEKCRGKVTSLQLEGCVEFMGPTNEPWTAYNDADVIIFPSISEGFPYAVVEAMACGAAIVATNVGGVAEALGDCGMLVPARNPRALADAVCLLLRDETERRRLGKMARARVLRHFTEQISLESYEHTYLGLQSRVPQRTLAACP
jgi:glycosyltransferase involved in cell wall biosynthesis